MSSPPPDFQLQSESANPTSSVDVTIPIEDLAEERSRWLSQLKKDNPQLFALRERVLPWTGGHSFSNLVYTDSTAVLAHVNRYQILELVYQHLNAIGLFNTAETLQEESQLKFQQSKQPWDKTTLMLLVSLGVLPNENPWEIPIDTHHQFIDELLEEDFFASPYRNPNMHLIYKELEDPNYNAVYSDGKQTLNTLIKGSLNRLVVLVTTTGNQHALQDTTKFFLSLHAITSSEHFLEHLITLFDLDFTKHTNIPYTQSQLRLMIVNVIKKWVNEHGKFIGNRTIKLINNFFHRILEDDDCKNLYTYTQAVLAYLPTIQYGPKKLSPGTATAPPIISNYQILFNPSLKIIDPDPQEVARQLTLIFHNAFKVVHSREFFIASRIKGISHQTPTLSEFYDSGKKLTLLIFETIVEAQDVSQAILKTLQIGECLDKLNNFYALACLIIALDQPIIKNHPTMQIIQNKDKYEQLRTRCGENRQNLEVYNDAIKDLFVHNYPAIPNMICEFNLDGRNPHSNEKKGQLNNMTIVGSPIDKNIDGISQSVPNSFNSVGVNDSLRSTIGNDGMINWEMISSNSDKTLMFYWFQFKCRPYSFYPIPQIQDVINRGPTMTKEQLKWDDQDSKNKKKGVSFDKSSLFNRSKARLPNLFENSSDLKAYPSSYS